MKDSISFCMLIDSHCHLSFKDYSPEELDAILERANEAGVGHLITIGAGEGIEGNAEAIKVAEKYPQVYCTVGIHPHDAKLVTPEVMQQMEVWAAHPKVVAIGEIGLDYHYLHSPKEDQIRVLNDFIKLAQRHKKPIAIHDRDAGDETHDILKAHGVKPGEVMIHCFTGSKELAKKYLELGCYLSFTGIVTFKKSTELQEIVKTTPVERMLIETDSPFLAPEPYRGKRNEPAYVKHVAEKVAQLQGLSFEDVSRITSLNAKRFFSLPNQDVEVSIAYAIRDSLYLNITNRCTLACTFCPKFIDYEVKGYYLKLPKEPVIEEIFAAMGDYSKYKEVVFCGYGEPTRKLDVLLEVAKRIRADHPEMRIRINTDGLGNLVHQRNILAELSPYVDALSISLNAQDAATYAKNCPSKYKEAAYPAVKEFIKLAPQYIKDVTASAVGMPNVDEAACKKIAEEELGVKFRFRPLDNVG